MPVIATTKLWETEDVQEFLWGLVKVNQAQMRRGLVPRSGLYQSGVRYQAEPLGSEVWQTAKEVYSHRVADCEDLVALRCAELLMAGQDVSPYVKDVRPGLRHCLVRHASGALECPSRTLGMGKG